MVLRLFIVSHFRLFTSTLMALFALAPQHLSSQQWTPAGQMIGPLMWEFPLSLPDGTHLIPLRWVNARRNDSLYWFDIKSFTTTPKMHERQTLGYKSIGDLRDFDSDGLMDLSGQTFSSLGTILYAALTDKQHTKEVVPGAAGALYGVTNRYFGDIDGDGLNDDLSADGPNAVRIVFGDRVHPLIGPSYVVLFDNSREIYPDLQPTKVAAVGMLGGKPCVVQSYQLLPETAPFYELHELNMDDLRARAPKIRTRLVQKVNVGENRRYGNVVLRTADVWWLFSSYGTDSSPNGIKITLTSMTLEPVSDFWRRGWQQYFGQSDFNLDESFPRVIDGSRPFIRLDRDSTVLPGGQISHHHVFTYVELSDVHTSQVNFLGRAQPPDSTIWDASLARVAVVSDLDQDSLMDLVINYWYRSQVTKRYDTACVALYLTSQRSTVSVKDDAADSTNLIVDQGESWRIVGGVSCSIELAQSAKIYNVNGTVVASVTLTVNGTDLILDKPKTLSHQALWLRLGSCTLRLP